MIIVHQFLDFIDTIAAASAGFLEYQPRVTRLGGKMIKVPIIGIGAIIRHAGQRAGLVGFVRVLEPGEAGAQMFGNAEGQAIFLRRLLPFAHHVAMRPYLHGVPAMQLRIPQEEIVVVRRPC